MNQKLTLVLNSGSSSIKFKIFTKDLKVVASGIMEKIGLPGSFVDFILDKTKKHSTINLENHEAAIKQLFLLLNKAGINFENITKIGHRVVHGGEKFIKPTLVDRKVLRELKRYNKLAPLHNPKNIAGIEACMNILPQAKNYAVFAYLYPLPAKIYHKYHIRRYGFHGISHQYVAEESARILKKTKPNLIVCHLGSGDSITAIKEGKSVDTSMGFTPLEGLMMSTRTGDMDPALGMFLHHEGMNQTKIQHLFNSESGLLGVSGLKDMRDVMIANGYKIPGYQSSVKFTAENKKWARIALQMFVYRVRKYIGAYSLILGHVDALVFTAGIGERNQDVRNLITKGLKFKKLVIPTNEELMIAKLIA